MEGTDALVAQLDRASDYGSEGCEFESRRAHQNQNTPAVFFLFYWFFKENMLY